MIDNDVRYENEYYEIQEFMTKYGDELPSKLLELYKRPIGYVCPNCHGLGVVPERYNAYPSGLPDSGWGVDWQYRDVECHVCGGLGYTRNKLVPKMIQDEWIEED